MGTSKDNCQTLHPPKERLLGLSKCDFLVGVGKGNPLWETKILLPSISGKLWVWLAFWRSSWTIKSTVHHIP